MKHQFFRWTLLPLALVLVVLSGCGNQATSTLPPPNVDVLVPTSTAATVRVEVVVIIATPVAAGGQSASAMTATPAAATGAVSMPAQATPGVGEQTTGAAATTPSTGEGAAPAGEATPTAANGGTTQTASTQTGQMSEQQLINLGEEVYSTNCAACHQLNGAGTNLYPALNQSALLAAEDPTAAIQTVLHGRGQMPAFEDTLAPQQIAAVLSYERNSWNNNAAAVTIAQVRQVRQGGSATETGQTATNTENEGVQVASEGESAATGTPAPTGEATGAAATTAPVAPTAAMTTSQAVTASADMQSIVATQEAIVATLAAIATQPAITGAATAAPPTAVTATATMTATAPVTATLSPAGAVTPAPQATITATMTLTQTPSPAGAGALPGAAGGTAPPLTWTPAREVTPLLPATVLPTTAATTTVTPAPNGATASPAMTATMTTTMTTTATTGAATPEAPSAAGTPQANAGGGAQALISRGETIYASNCASCHQLSGEGTSVYPALNNSELLTAEDPTQAIQTVLQGRGQMPAFAGTLSNEEIAAVLSYERNSWDNNASPVTVAQVAQVQTASGQ